MMMSQRLAQGIGSACLCRRFVFQSIDGVAWQMTGALFPTLGHLGTAGSPGIRRKPIKRMLRARGNSR
jgi:hypothetical protein